MKQKEIPRELRWLSLAFADSQPLVTLLEPEHKARHLLARAGVVLLVVAIGLLLWADPTGPLSR